MSYQNRGYWSHLHDTHVGELSAVGYPALGIGFNQVAYTRRLEATKHLLERRNTTFPSVLEAAVGVGAYGPLWRDFGCERWVGVDISEGAIDHLRASHPEGEFHVLDLTSDARQWPLDTNRRFDLVSAIDVLYHLTDDKGFESALAQLAELVAPGGLLLVSDIFVDKPVQIEAHVRRRPLSTYLEVLRKRGFEAVDRETVFAILGDPIRRPGFHLQDEALYATWRILQKTIRITPGPLRNSFGALLASSLRPADALLCRLPSVRGVNLELALFRRAPAAQ